MPVVYVGANDGMLHGFNATTGDEVFAYVPNKIIDGSQSFKNDLERFTSPFYYHQYYVDLTPRLNDAFIKTGVSGTKAWQSVSRVTSALKVQHSPPSARIIA